MQRKVGEKNKSGGGSRGEKCEETGRCKGKGAFILEGFFLCKNSNNRLLNTRPIMTEYEDESKKAAHNMLCGIIKLRLSKNQKRLENK